MVGGLVENDEVKFLNKCGGKCDTAFFPTGKLLYGRIESEVSNAETSHCGTDTGIGSPLIGIQSLAGEDRFPHSGSGWEWGSLRDDGEP